MAIADRRLRERESQHRLIVATARALAEREGWEAVTTRRLSNEIEYSQPVIYKHFRSMEDLVEAVAVEGFLELAEALGRARCTGQRKSAVATAARAYCSYAEENPAVYEAMFTRHTQLHFATADTPAPLTTAYARLRTVVAEIAGRRDVDTLTEVVWAAFHGLVALSRSHRLRLDWDTDRLEMMIAQFVGTE